MAGVVLPTCSRLWVPLPQGWWPSQIVDWHWLPVILSPGGQYIQAFITGATYEPDWYQGTMAYIAANLQALKLVSSRSFEIRSCLRASDIWSFDIRHFVSTIILVRSLADELLTFNILAHDILPWTIIFLRTITYDHLAHELLPYSIFFLRTFTYKLLTYDLFSLRTFAYNLLSLDVLP